MYFFLKRIKLLKMSLSFSNKSFMKIRESFFVFRQKTLDQSIKNFVDGFPGKIAYSVKTNPSKFLIESLYNNGIKSFDVASINEVRLLKNIFVDSEIFYMNPVKSRTSISEAYFKYKVKNFCIDSLNEFKKILQETDDANDLIIHIRISVSNKYAKVKLLDKFGIGPSSAKLLIKEVKKKAFKIGLCFHPGSQCMSPLAYLVPMEKILVITKILGIKIDYLNIGGGFPSTYIDMNPPPLKEYFSIIKKKFNDFHMNEDIVLMCEPGRSIVSKCMSLIVKVELRKGNKLYINDGIYGNLGDVGKNNFIYPVRLISKKKSMLDKVPFSFFGPTCDSRDFIRGPFYLPENIKEGDYIEIEQMGAYSHTMKTNFNGFLSQSKVFYVDEKPITDIDFFFKKKIKKELV